MLKNNKILQMIASALSSYIILLTISIKENRIIVENRMFVLILLTLFIYMVIRFNNENKNIEEKNKRLKVITCIISVFFAVMYIIGELTNSGFDTVKVILSKKIILYSVFKVISISYVMKNLLQILYVNIEQKTDSDIKEKDTKLNRCIEKILKNDIKGFILRSLILIVLWIPYLLILYPGVTSWDTNQSLLQGYGITPYRNLHPVIHTFIISNINKFAHNLTGSYQSGIALNALIQIIVTSMMFSFIVGYMKNLNICKKIRIIGFTFIGLYPVIGHFSVIVWKDIVFNLLIVLSSLVIIEILKEKNIKNLKLNILWIILLYFMMLYKNNGIYIEVLSSIVILTYLIFNNRKNIIRVAIILILPVILYLTTTNVIFKQLKILGPTPGEAMGIPIQGLARNIKINGEDFTPEEKEQIGYFFDFEKVKELYNPRLSDNMKNMIAHKLEDKSNIIKIAKLYIRMLRRYPLDTIQAFFSNTEGYYYINTDMHGVTTDVYNSPLESDRIAMLERKPKIIKIDNINEIMQNIYTGKTPILSIFINVPFLVWSYIIMIGYLIYRKRYLDIIPFIPLAVLVLTAIASPVSGEQRYILAILYGYPLFLGITLNKNYILKGNKDEEK